MDDMTRYAQWLFAQECTFVAGATTYAAIPSLALPEVAFVGKSNVGKSSLINALTGRKTLARVSHTPGRTRQVNFFSLGEALMLVDLPGYGYAKTSKREIAGWGKLIYDYLRGRPNLCRVCVLIDSRRGIKEHDEEILELLDEMAVSYQIILTKADKGKTAEIDGLVTEISQHRAPRHTALHPDVCVTSSRDTIGISQLREELARFSRNQTMDHT